MSTSDLALTDLGTVYRIIGLYNPNAGRDLDDTKFVKNFKILGVDLI